MFTTKWQIFQAVLLFHIVAIQGCGRKEVSNPSPTPPTAGTVLTPWIISIEGNETEAGLPGISGSPGPMEETSTLSHKLPCTLEESYHCFNGGTCFAVMLGDEREVACHCPHTKTGTRCEEEIIILVRQPFAAQTAVIAIVIVIAVAVGFGVLGFYVYRRYKRKDRRSRMPADGVAIDDEDNMDAGEELPMTNDVENGNVDFSNSRDHDNHLLTTGKPTSL